MITVLWEQGHWPGQLVSEVDGGRTAGVEYTGLPDLAQNKVPVVVFGPRLAVMTPCPWSTQCACLAHMGYQLSPLCTGVDSGQGGVAVQAHMALAGSLQLMVSFLGLVLL